MSKRVIKYLFLIIILVSVGLLIYFKTDSVTPAPIVPAATAILPTAPVSTPTPTPVPTPVLTPTPVPTPTPASTPVPTPTPASTPVPTPTPASTPVPTPVSAPASSAPAPVSPPVVSAAPAAKPKAALSNIIISVPFTAQAPLGGWDDERQQDGCEEASAAMAMAWVKNENNITKEEWLRRILAMADFENKKYGEHRDVALKDVVSWLFNDYFNYQKAAIKPVAAAADILNELEAGRVVLIPANGQALGNPYFTSPGPERHMLLIKGYDYKTDQFITNDPGTRRGENYRYSSETIFNAIRPYQTGNKLPFPALVREMIVVSR